MKRGRKPSPGTVYYLGRLRFRPGVDPPELKKLLESIIAAPAGKRADILRAALLGGASEARETADKTEDSATETLLDEMFDAF